MLYVYMQPYDYDRQALPLFRCSLLLLKEQLYHCGKLNSNIYHERAAFTLDG